MFVWFGRALADRQVFPVKRCRTDGRGCISCGSGVTLTARCSAAAAAAAVAAVEQPKRWTKRIPQGHMNGEVMKAETRRMQEAFSTCSLEGMHFWSIRYSVPLRPSFSVWRAHMCPKVNIPGSIKSTTNDLPYFSIFNQYCLMSACGGGSDIYLWKVEAEEVEKQLQQLLCSWVYGGRTETGTWMSPSCLLRVWTQSQAFNVPQTKQTCGQCNCAKC